MGQLFLVRHGQASLGATDYDQLSPLGDQQSRRLGEHWKAQGLTFDAVVTGAMKRHSQTLTGIQQGMGTQHEALIWPGLNEYDADAIIRTILPGELVKPTTPEGYKQHFRLLRDGLTQWMTGVVSPQGMPSYTEFVKGVTSALDHIRANCDGNVLLVSSGGPIATAVAHVLRTSPENSIELNMRLRNSAVSEFSFNPKRHSLISFNGLAHLETPSHKDWITFA
ncbi:histidine phosphatase family protein [Limnohabitans sp. Jir61]|uniref:histidine phosphatase family protein n=1 Tax=Limnohabitans sp. Jir61 TaxID=1826168 RepID=UPI000D347BC9|nr:histidine phosphatase family protein [Limnohabitans sp. Jir61]PUE32020.1 histidine phosphatase family protein [Limnohabitans sp. Jir61]